MPARADAHLHFFAPGYVAKLPSNCRRVQPDEMTLYSALAQPHAIEAVLAVGYEGAAWAAGNNRYLTELAATHSWVKPVAFIANPIQLSVGTLEQLAREHFVGLSLYVFEQAIRDALMQVAPAVWRWLEAHHWLISVNSRGEHWQVWQLILAQYPNLRLLVSHGGLPPAVAVAPDPQVAQAALATVCALAPFAGVRVKLSGFYALATPDYAYPHRAAWPYVQVLLGTFGVQRLLWGSDFSPSLESLSFPQTLAVLEQMPFLSAADRQLIEGENLLALLAQVRGVEC